MLKMYMKVENAGDGTESGSRDSALGVQRARLLGLVRARGCGAALFACGVFALVISHRQITASLPYPQHIDEHHLSSRAAAILRTGNLNPEFFRYPSLPIYLSALGMGAGAVLAASSGELTGLNDLGSVEAPYYTQPRVMWVCRMLFALLMSAAIPVVGAIALRMGGGRLSAVLSAIALLSCVPYVTGGFRYLNVDIIAAFFATVAVWQMLRAMERPTFAGLVLWPAALCGATIASKYPSGVILLPGILAIVSRAPAERRWSWAGQFVVLACVAFVVACPYSLLDVRTFLNDVIFEVAHYQYGHPGQDSAPGWAQLQYYGARVNDAYGVALLGLAFAGFIASMARDALRTLVLLAYPVGLVLFMSRQHVHFERNILPAYPVLAVLIGLGLEAMGAWLTRGLRRVPRLRAPRLIAAAFLLVVVASSSPLRAVARRYTPRPDTRSELAAYIRANVPPATIAIPDGFDFDPRTLGDRFRVERVPQGVRARRRLGELAAAGDCYFIATPFRLNAPRAEAATRARKLRALGLGAAVIKVKGRTNGWRLTRDPAVSLYRCRPSR